MSKIKHPEKAPTPTSDISVLKRVAAILELMTEDRPYLKVEDVSARLQVSAATAYRYVADLCEMGLLHRISGAYAPGPKVLELDYLIRRFDPMLQVSASTVTELSRQTHCHVLLSRLYGLSMVNVFYAKAEGLPDIPFIPGRRLPIFQGSPSRVVLAHMDRRRLRRVFDANESDPWRAKIGATWEEFVAANQQVRKAGCYVSRNELAPDTTGVAVPIFDDTGDAIGALAMTFASSAPPWLGEDMIVQLATQHARTISREIALLSAKLG
jgi:DNA-binding IclR family transcriptional regulator